MAGQTKTMKGHGRIDRKLQRDMAGQTKNYEGTRQDRQKTMKGHGRIDKKL